MTKSVTVMMWMPLVIADFSVTLKLYVVRHKRLSIMQIIVHITLWHVLISLLWHVIVLFQKQLMRYVVSDSPAANLYVMKEMVTASVDVKQTMMIMKAYNEDIGPETL